MMFDLLQLRPLMPEILLAVSALGLLMVGAFGQARAVTFVVLAASLALVAAFYFSAESDATSVTVLHGMFESNLFTKYAKMLVIISTLLSLILSAPWLMAEGNRRFEYPILILFVTLGGMLMVSAADIMALYMGLELLSLSLYVLAAFDRDDMRSNEAGLKYFVLGALASGMLLFGASLVYGFTGTTSFAGLATLFTENPTPSSGLLTGLVLILVAFCFKISAAPFHMWTPDVYEGAPTPVTALFATAPKVAALCLLTRLLVGPFGAMTESWQQIIAFVSVLSMLVGAFGALRQSNFKRLLAYSSIGHVGYMLVALCTGTVSGVTGLLVYLSLYIFMSVGSFACLILLRKEGREITLIEELAGLSRRQPKLAFALAIFMFAMAGIPPLSGFFAKLYVFLSAVESGFILLAVIGVLTSVVGCYYYLRIIKLMYFDEAGAAFDTPKFYALRYMVFGTAAFTFLYILSPTALIAAAQVAAQSLLR